MQYLRTESPERGLAGNTPIYSFAWQPKRSMLYPVDRLVRKHRQAVSKELGPLVRAHYPALIDKDDIEYPKMLELSTKMTMAGHACSEIAGFQFDGHRLALSALYGGCCFLADSFIDEYGEAVAREYIDRFELLLTKGWFEIRNEREQLFYAILSRIFSRRDVLEPMLRQAIFSLFLAQKRDVVLRLNAPTFRALPRSRQLAMLRQCARDRGGHTIMVLTCLLAPHVPLRYQHLIFLAGALFMFIDDHGDCSADWRSNRITYMNQVRFPELTLGGIVDATMRKLVTGLPDNPGKDLICTFLFRYFVTRIEKHALEQKKGGLSWAVYE